MTEWLPVPGYEGHYEVSDAGTVRSLYREVRTKGGWVQSHAGKPLKAGTVNGNCHQLVVLSKNGVVKSFLIHRLVLEAFVGPRPLGMWACHANDDGRDNRLENLRWDTPSANSLDCIRNGRHKGANKTHCKRGHEFTPDNTYTRPGTSTRQCRSCVSITRKSAKV